CFLQHLLGEAPAPGMAGERRAARGRAAVDAARAVGYIGAGTVEFIANPDGGFYFMEMNTRLQVEHPVTEMITGLDLVEWQLRVAAGEPLPRAQDDLAIDGHAIEARIYAEDPDAGFLPATGRLVHLEPPATSVHVRVDSGVEQGDSISPHYDPMIAKLIVWDSDRDGALARMRRALADFHVVGVSNNIAFLGRLVTTTAFASADLDTALIEREHAHLFPPPAPTPRAAWLIAALAELVHAGAAAATRLAGSDERHNPWVITDDWRLNGHGRRLLTLRDGETEKTLAICAAGGAYAIELDGETSTATLLGHDGAALSVALDGTTRHVAVAVTDARRAVFLDGRAWVLARVDKLEASGEGEEGGAGLLAPMPGKVIALIAAPGATVKKGDKLLVLEAMKMEHTICAPADGVVKAFHCTEGEQVTEGVELVDFEHA
ncbi:MAG: biotin/lipoyl-containing protein, partial [Gammaproteobacteria bacterium]